MSEILKVNDLCKESILSDISFSVKSGEMVAIMGPSGSGKSTLLYNVSGMSDADSGEVWLGDKEIVALSQDDKARLRLEKIGFVFQQMNVLSNLSIIENIVLPAYQLNKQKKGKKKKEELLEQAENLMKKLGIEEIADRQTNQVSGGQLQRACICRSIMNRPEIIFADEPTGALNQTSAAEVMKAFLQLNEEGTTILMVTHDAKVAAKCDRIIYILDGELKGELDLNGVQEKENMVTEWLRKMGW